MFVITAMSGELTWEWTKSQVRKGIADSVVKEHWGFARDQSSLAYHRVITQATEYQGAGIGLPDQGWFGIR